jgi:hypothetical protein
MKMNKIIITILSIATIILGFLYYNVKKENKYLMDSKNFTFEWNNNEEILFSYWKNNNKFANQFVDKNYDNNYEVITAHDIYGNIVTSSYDLNENGVIEKCINYNSYGKIIGNCQDKDEDGAFEEFSIILENKNELTFIDLNNNGQYNKIVLFNKEKNKRTEKLIEKLFE